MSGTPRKNKYIKKYLEALREEKRSQNTVLEVDRNLFFKIRTSPNTRHWFQTFNRPARYQEVKTSLFKTKGKFQANFHSNSLSQVTAFKLKRKYLNFRQRGLFSKKRKIAPRDNRGFAQVNIVNMAEEALNRIERRLNEAQVDARANRFMSLAPKPFSGGLNEDYPIFLDRLSLYFTDLGLTDEQKLQKFPLYLTGNAFVEYQASTPEERADWERLKTWFTQCFGSNDRKHVWRNLLANRRLEPNESLTDYYTDIQHLSRKLGLDQDNACAAFIRNLDPELAQVVGPQRPANMSQAFQIACLYRESGRNASLHRESGKATSEGKNVTEPKLDLNTQVLLKLLEDKDSESKKLAKLLEKLELKTDDRKSKQVKSIQYSPYEVVDDCPDFMWHTPHINALQTEVSNGYPRYTGSNGQGYRPTPPQSKIICQFCSRPNHTAAVCYEILRLRQGGQGQRAPPAPNYQNYKGGRSNQIMCFRCSGQGHIAKFCNVNISGLQNMQNGGRNGNPYNNHVNNGNPGQTEPKN